MRCPHCAGSDDRVVDSRVADEGASIRRRRECLGCSRRFTTYERVEEAFVVVKRSGATEPFDRAKVMSGMAAAAKNRPALLSSLEVLAAEVEEEVRVLGAEVSTEAVGVAVLARLRLLDEVAAVRFASVYNSFEDLTDFRREVGLVAEGHNDDEERSAR